MSRAQANCPSCGAPVEFLWAGAVQTTCTYCTSVLVRHDLDLAAVGVKSHLPPTSSPIQVGTRGAYKGRTFLVVGRIVYAYERGGWNEWHLVFGDGTSGWLSDAMAEYAVTTLAAGQHLPPPGSLRPGQSFRFGGTEYQVSTLTRAKYVGVEGELPFEYWDKGEVPFADLRTLEGGFATIDYSESPPLLYTGEYVPFDELRLSELREPETVRAGGARTLQCPNCGGAVELRAAERTINVACTSCASVLDARTPGLDVLQRYQARIKRKPKIPLGSRGRLHGEEWDVIGFQVRSIRADGVDYAWDEYLLYNARRGFRYLTEYQGHWNDAIPVHSLPKEGNSGGRPTAHFHGETFQHFQTATAETVFVLGEFPWEVRAGDTALTRDYVHPPRMLSCEETGAERTWTLAEYTPGTRIWEAFKLPGSPPPVQGVYANQPSPHRNSSGGMWKAFLFLFALFLAAFVWRAGSGSQEVARQSFVYDPSGARENQVGILGPFQLGGRTSSVGVTIDTDLQNRWVYFDLSLVNEETGTALEFGREVSYYSGTDSDGSWTEGDRTDDVRIPSVPPGRYVMRIFPQAGDSAAISYTVKLERDRPAFSFWMIALVFLVIPPLFSGLRSAGFETQRWAESDYAPTGDDDDD